MIKTLAAILVICLSLVHVVLAIPFTFRLLVEAVNQIDLRINFGIRLPFDWQYVTKGKESLAKAAK